MCTILSCILCNMELGGNRMELHTCITFLRMVGCVPSLICKLNFTFHNPCFSITYSYNVLEGHRLVRIHGHSLPHSYTITCQRLKCIAFITRCYYMPLNIFLKDFPSRAESRWEQDVGAFEEEQWQKALQAVQSCSLNATQRLSQLYILLMVHYMLARLFKVGLRENLTCTRCAREHGDQIHLL